MGAHPLLGGEKPWERGCYTHRDLIRIMNSVFYWFFSFLFRSLCIVFNSNFFRKIFSICMLNSTKIFTGLIIKITISSIVIGLKNSYFPLIHLPSCYRTVCYRTACYRTVCYRTVQQTNHIQSCSLNQPITFKVEV